MRASVQPLKGLVVLFSKPPAGSEQRLHDLAARLGAHVVCRIMCTTKVLTSSH